jgi:uncharacterized DUF497 family protein
MKSYEWDEKKAKANFKKHGITFGEATEVFDDSHALYIQDPTDSDEERTWIIGFTTRSPKHLIVVFCDRSIEDKQEVYRIISARRLTAKERRNLGRF